MKKSPLRLTWPWALPAYGLSAAVLTILLSLLFSFGSGEQDIWAHLQLLLPTYIRQSLLLCIAISTISVVWGGCLGFCLTFIDFPYKKLCEYLLILPLAMPAYVMGFIVSGLLSYTGPLYQFLKSYQINIPEGRGIIGLIISLSMSSFPYAYLLIRQGLLSQSQNVFDAARSLGTSRRRLLVKILIPQAFPAFLTAFFLIAMEVLADFGTVSIFGVETLTTGIYKSWFGFFSLATAGKLSFILALFAALLLYLEIYAERKSQRYAAKKPLSEKALKKCFSFSLRERFLAYSFVFFTIFLAVIIPLGQLLLWASSSLTLVHLKRLWQATGYSFLLATVVAILASLVALVSASATRLSPQRWDYILKSLARLGYALPGTVLAVGVFLPFSWIKQTLLGINILNTPALHFLFALIVIISGLLIRFYAVAYGSIQRGFKPLSKSLDDASYTLGHKPLSILKRIFWPLLKSDFLVAFLWVFVEVVKEMPVTLMTRPSGLNFLSVKIFEYTSEGEWELAALPSLLLVALGSIPVLLLSIRRGAK